ncbi:hypothetical protein OSTOST_18439 [Ostertagia ostertagi]
MGSAVSTSTCPILFQIAESEEERYSRRIFIDEKVFNGEEHRGETLQEAPGTLVTIRNVPNVSKLSVTALISKKK